MSIDDSSLRELFSELRHELYHEFDAQWSRVRDQIRQDIAAAFANAIKANGLGHSVHCGHATRAQDDRVLKSSKMTRDEDREFDKVLELEKVPPKNGDEHLMITTLDSSSELRTDAHRSPTGSGIYDTLELDASSNSSISKSKDKVYDSINGNVYINCNQTRQLRQSSKELLKIVEDFSAGKFEVQELEEKVTRWSMPIKRKNSYEMATSNVSSASILNVSRDAESPTSKSPSSSSPWKNFFMSRLRHEKVRQELIKQMSLMNAQNSTRVVEVSSDYDLRYQCSNVLTPAIDRD